MKKVLFMEPVLRFIGEGRLFTGVVASAVRIFALLLGVGVFVAWVQLWKLVFNMHGAAVLGGLLFQGFFVVGAYMVVHTMWLRSMDIQHIERSDFNVTPILSILVRMLGEIYACISTTLGVGGGVAVLFGSYLAPYITEFIPGIAWPQALLFRPFAGGTSAFVSALLLAVGGAISAVIWLLVFYFMSEILLAVIDIARNTKVLRAIAERSRQTGGNS